MWFINAAPSDIPISYLLAIACLGNIVYSFHNLLDFHAYDKKYNFNFKSIWSQIMSKQRIVFGLYDMVPDGLIT